MDFDPGEHFVPDPCGPYRYRVRVVRKADGTTACFAKRPPIAMISLFLFLIGGTYVLTLVLLSNGSIGSAHWPGRRTFLIFSWILTAVALPPAALVPFAMVAKWRRQRDLAVIEPDTQQCRLPRAGTSVPLDSIVSVRSVLTNCINWSNRNEGSKFRFAQIQLRASGGDVSALLPIATYVHGLPLSWVSKEADKLAAMLGVPRERHYENTSGDFLSEDMFTYLNGGDSSRNVAWMVSHR